MVVAAKTLCLTVVLVTAAGCWWRSSNYVPDPDRTKDLPEDPIALVRHADAVIAPARIALKPPQLGNTERALAALEKALERGHPAPYEPLWRLSRACFLISRVLDEEKEKHVFARRGIDYAQRALKLDDDRVEAHYFLALNTAGLAESTSNVKLIGFMVALLEKARSIDRTYDDAGPLRALGKIYLTAPAWPVSVGSPSKAVEVLQEAVKLCPVALNRVFLGQAYYHDEDYRKAEQVLKAVLHDAESKRLDPRWYKEAEDYLRRIGTGSTTDPRTTL